MLRSVLVVVLSIMITPYISFSETIDVQIKGLDDGVKTSKQQDYKEAVLFAKREAIERAGVRVQSATTIKDLIVESDYIETKAEALLLPGYTILDIGYSEQGYYTVVLIGKVKTVIIYDQNADHDVVLIDETFSDNLNKWPLSSHFKINNGVCDITPPAGKHAFKTNIPVELDGPDDFLIDTTIKVKKCSDNSCIYGLIIGSDSDRGSKNGYVFLLTNSSYLFGFTKADKAEVIIPWTLNKAIRNEYSKRATYLVKSVDDPTPFQDGSVENRLTVVRQNNKISFYINYQSVADVNFGGLHGKYFGFYYKNCEIAVNQFLVKKLGKKFSKTEFLSKIKNEDPNYKEKFPLHIKVSYEPNHNCRRSGWVNLYFFIDNADKGSKSFDHCEKFQDELMLTAMVEEGYHNVRVDGHCAYTIKGYSGAEDGYIIEEFNKSIKVESPTQVIVNLTGYKNFISNKPGAKIESITVD